MVIFLIEHFFTHLALLSLAVNNSGLYTQTWTSCPPSSSPIYWRTTAYPQNIKCSVRQLKLSTPGFLRKRWYKYIVFYRSLLVFGMKSLPLPHCCRLSVQPVDMPLAQLLYLCNCIIRLLVHPTLCAARTEARESCQTFFINNIKWSNSGQTDKNVNCFTVEKTEKERE